MAKNKNQNAAPAAPKSIADMNPAELEQYKLNLQNQQAEIERKMIAARNVEAEKRRQVYNTVGEKLVTFQGELSNILGRPVTLEEFAGFIRSKIKGSLGSLVSTNGNSVRAASKFLSDDEKRALHARLVTRQLKLKEGHGVAEQPSKIAEDFGVSVPTVNNYASRWKLTRADANYSEKTHPAIVEVEAAPQANQAAENQAAQAPALVGATA